MEATERDLIEACCEIGNISGCNRDFTEGIARMISNGGKSVREMTVGELIELSRAYSAVFNRRYSSSEGDLS